MADFVGQPLVQALAWTLVHFFWQGAAIAVLAFVLMRSSRLPGTRYAIGAGALAAMLVAPIVTLLIEMSASIVIDAQLTLASALPSASATFASAGADNGATLGPSLPDTALAFIVGVWFAGVVAFSLRLAGGWLVARRVAREAVRPAAAEIQRLALAVGARLGVRRAVMVLESSVVAVPVMVGWLKPVIVLPAAALAGLTPDQLESLIAHELAHVRRHDFLVNLLQSIVEALLFYHPAVWWMSRRVRMERERCCDDVTVGVCDRLVYAEALKELATMASPRFALAATDGDLLSRIRRVLGQADDEAGRSSRWVPLVIVAATLVLAVQASFVLAAPGTRERARANDEPPLSLTAMQTGEAAVTQLIEGQQSQTREVRPEQRTERESSEAEALKREYDALLRRYQGEMERLQLRLNGQATSAQIQEALAKALDQSKEQRQAVIEEQAMKQAIERAKIETDRMRTLYEKGLVSKAQLADMEAMLRVMSQRATEDFKNADLLAQHQLGRQYEMEKMLAELAQHQQNRSAEVEKMKRELDQHLKATLQERSAEIEKVKRAIDEHLKATMNARAAEAAKLEHGRNLTPVEGPAAQGDVLEVRIGGEPDLPTHYEVKADGTIRVPFLGSFKVVGQTAAQVRTAIGKQLSDRKLGQANQVTVNVLRGR